MQLISNPGMTQDYQTAQELYDRGNFSRASLMAEEQHDLKGYTLALRAALVHGGHVARGEEAIEWLERAEWLAEEVMAMDNHNLRNRLSMMLVTSYKGKQLRSIRLVNRAREMIDGLIMDYPDEAMAYAALAGWHSELSAAGFLPRLVFGASRKKARENFEKARSLDATKISINLEYAKYLARGGKKERTSAQNLLIAVIEAVPHDAFDSLLQKNAQALLAAVRTGEKKEIKNTIAAIAAFPDF